jgi:hypothetical protein
MMRVNQFLVRLMWVPAQVGIDGKKMVDRITKESAASGNLQQNFQTFLKIPFSVSRIFLCKWLVFLALFQIFFLQKSQV